MPAAGGFDDAKQFWDARFAAPDYIFGTAPNVFLAAQRTLFQPGMRVLEIGCGEGRNSVWLAQQGCVVTGVDISPRALAKADKLAAERGVKVQWIEADIADWVWQAERFDDDPERGIYWGPPSEPGGVPRRWSRHWFDWRREELAR